MSESSVASFPSPARRLVLAGFAALNALAAWGGAAGLITGTLDFGDRINHRLPFDSLVLAGLALATLVAAPLTLLAWAAWNGRPSTEELSFVAGLMLVGWIVGQVAVIRSFSGFQPVCLAVGAVLIATSHRVHLGVHRRGALFAALGSVFAAVGIGLLPHLINTGIA